MKNLLLYFRKMRLRKQNGFAILETLLLIIVVAFTVGAILQTAFLTTTLQVTGRRYLESHKSMVSFFNNLETVEALDMISGDIFTIVRTIDPVGSYTNIESPHVDSYNDKVVNIKIILADSDKSRREIVKAYNVFSNKTVSDDRYKSRG